MATNLDLDDALIREAQEVGCHKTKKGAVTAALQEYIQKRRRLEILELKGSIPYHDDYDHKALRKRR